MIKLTLKKYMDENNLTMQEVAKKTGLSRNTISQLYNNSGKGIQFDTLDRLVNSLDISIYEILEEKYYSDSDTLSWKIETYNSDEQEFDVTFSNHLSERLFSLTLQISDSSTSDKLSYFYTISCDLNNSDSKEIFTISDFFLQYESYLLETNFFDISKQIITLFEQKIDLTELTSWKDFPDDIVFKLETTYNNVFSYIWPKKYFKDNSLFSAMLKYKYDKYEYPENFKEFGYIDEYGDFFPDYDKLK